MPLGSSLALLVFMHSQQQYSHVLKLKICTPNAYIISPSTKTNISTDVILDNISNMVPSFKEKKSSINEAPTPSIGKGCCIFSCAKVEITHKKMGAMTNVMVASILIRTWSEGPAVSLNGSPTVSPVTAAL